MDDNWCEHTGIIDTDFKAPRPKHVRCPKCRRRLIPKTTNAEPLGTIFEPVYSIPRHKIPHGKRKKK